MTDTLPARLFDPRCPSERPEMSLCPRATAHIRLAEALQDILENVDADDMTIEAQNAVFDMAEAAEQLVAVLAARHPDEWATEMEPALESPMTKRRKFMDSLGWRFNDITKRWEVRP